MNRAIMFLGLVLAMPPTFCVAGGMPQAAAWDAADLAGFLDGTMEAQRRTHHFAGAVVVLVRDGRVIYQKGYGYADFAERKRVDPERTLFRIASNSKMFVWTAVMQLVEGGKLDLHTDVNRYLKGVQIATTFPQPVTMEHLMTHTAGFEDYVIGLFAKTPDKMLPLDVMMRTQMPRRVFPPGEVAAYSNYGTTLAALIVEQVSGIPFQRYLESRISQPLGMVHAASLFFQVCGLIGMPIAAVVQRGHYRPGLSRLARLTAWLTCLAWGAGFAVFLSFMQDPQQIVFGPTQAMILALNIWAVAALLTAVLLLFTILAWHRGWWRLAGRVWFTLILLGAIGCAIWLNHWNLLGWKY